MNVSQVLEKIPFLASPPQVEYFFTLGINQETLEAAVWSIEGDNLQIINSVSHPFAPDDDLVKAADLILDKVLGEQMLEPKKILFGVPDHWLSEGDLKEEYLKMIRAVVKELDLEPLAYVATTHAVIHFLEKQENTPPTAILVGIEKNFVTVYVSKVGRVEGSKATKRGDDLGSDVEKLLLSFTNIEVLPSRILIYGSLSVDLAKEKDILAIFPWMSKLPFLHLPKIETLPDNLVISAVSLAGGVELNSKVQLIHSSISPKVTSAVKEIPEEKKISKSADQQIGGSAETAETLINRPDEPTENGFVVGDITEEKESDSATTADQNTSESAESAEPIESNLTQSPPARQDVMLEAVSGGKLAKPREILNKIIQQVLALVGKIRAGKVQFVIPVVVLTLLIIAYLTLPRAQVLVYAEPRVLEKDTQVVADPTLKEVDESGNKIPGQIVETTVSGSDKAVATGKKSVGEEAKGRVKIINNSSQEVTLSKGTNITATNGLKFTLDSSVSIASTSAFADSKTTANVAATAAVVGADSNLPSGTQFTVSPPSSQVAVIADGNFSGGTSKEVTVVAEGDQQKLLATVASNLRQQAQTELQNKLNSQTKNLKILPEALLEEIAKKTFNKRVGDQASEFSLNLTIRYKGTAYSDEDLKLIVSKLVSTDIPADFELNLAQTETLADVSKLEKDGKLVFLARFNAKLMPKFDIQKLKRQIRGKSPSAAASVLKSYENVLGSEIRVTPSLPPPFQILPILEQNIKIEIGLK